MKDFATLDSGVKIVFPSGMNRDADDAKPRYDLIIPQEFPESSILHRWAALMKRGADKYGERNWELAHTLGERARATASLFRHFIAYTCGQRDEDHLAALLFNLQQIETINYRLAREKEADHGNQ